MKFTIRDLFWLTVVVALGVAWWIEHRQAETARNENKSLQEKFDDRQKAMASAFERAIENITGQPLIPLPKPKAPAPLPPKD